MQLYSVKKGMSQPIDGYASCFAHIKYEGYDTTLFIFASRAESGMKLFIIEVGHENKPQGAPKFEKKSSDIYFPPEMMNDFPVAIHVRGSPGFTRFSQRRFERAPTVTSPVSPRFARTGLQKVQSGVPHDADGMFPHVRPPHSSVCLPESCQ